jgi:flagellar basal-body rod modification protein FlgD
MALLTGGVIDTPKAAPINNVPTTNTTDTDSVTADQDKFMKLLITQLQNQDPLNPMDNAAMTSQLAQLSTVTGINKVNATLESLRSDQANAQSLTATGLIGKGVLVAGKGVQLNSSTDDKGVVTKGAVFGVDLASPAESVTVTIQDKSGVTVRTMSLPANADVGTYPISWDGTTDTKTVAPDGDYTISVKAVSAGKTLTDATPLQLAAVASVSTGSGGVKLNTTLGQFAMSDIKEVL